MYEKKKIEYSSRSSMMKTRDSHDETAAFPSRLINRYIDVLRYAQYDAGLDWPPRMVTFTTTDDKRPPLSLEQISQLLELASSVHGSVTDADITDWSGTSIKATPLRKTGTVAFILRQNSSVIALCNRDDLSDFCWRLAVSAWTVKPQHMKKSKRFEKLHKFHSDCISSAQHEQGIPLMTTRQCEEWRTLAGGQI